MGRRCATGPLDSGRAPRVAHLCRWPPADRQAGFDVALVKIVYDDGQYHKEGCEIESHGHVSFGERFDLAVDSHRNLPLLSGEQGSICIKRLDPSSRVFCMVEYLHNALHIDMGSLTLCRTPDVTVRAPAESTARRAG